MPRFARVVVPDYPHHVTQRGNARRDIFFTPADRLVYLGLLQQYSQLYSLRILGYVLMTNHVHVIAVPAHELSLAKTFREVHGRYAQYRNAIDRCTGHVIGRTATTPPCSKPPAWRPSCATSKSTPSAPVWSKTPPNTPGPA